MTRFDSIIRGGRAVTPDGVIRADIGVHDGRIAAIGAEIGAAEQEIAADGLWIMPGGIDPHAHIEQPSGMGLMNADTFESATAAALQGGTTTVISFAAQAKGQRLAEALADYEARAARGARCDHAYHLSISDPDVADFTTDLRAAAAAGHRSVKVFTTYDIALDDRRILDVLVLARDAGCLTCVHAETDGVLRWARDRLVAAGHLAPRHHAISRPVLAEVDAVSRICRFSAYLGAPVMLFHVSAAASLPVIAAAQADGAPVRAETCPHYLLMTDAVLDRPGIEGAKWMCSPPQRAAFDQAALWAGLKDGTLALVSSDHAPYRFDDTGKLRAGPTPAFPDIANGMPGLEMRMPLLFDAMLGGYLTPEGFAKISASAAARLYGLAPKGRIAVGADADLTLWDPAGTRVYAEDETHDRTGYNPWAGRPLRGRLRKVLLRGRVVVEDGTLTAPPGQGRWQRRDAIGLAATAPQAHPLLLEDRP